jgi:hypothetical protein
MFLKITRSGPRRYLQLVEAFRDEAGKARHRTLVTLGRLDQLDGQLDSVISGLLKATGRADLLKAPVPAIEFESARALGDVWTLNELWKSLGFVGLRRVSVGRWASRGIAAIPIVDDARRNVSTLFQHTVRDFYVTTSGSTVSTGVGTMASAPGVSSSCEASMARSGLMCTAAGGRATVGARLT